MLCRSTLHKKARVPRAVEHWCKGCGLVFLLSSPFMLILSQSISRTKSSHIEPSRTRLSGFNLAVGQLVPAYAILANICLVEANSRQWVSKRFSRDTNGVDSRPMRVAISLLGFNKDKIEEPSRPTIGYQSLKQVAKRL